MSLKIGIVGLPNVGKSTLFNALTKQSMPAENYPFCTIDPSVGIVPVWDERLGRLAKISQSKKIIPAVIEFVDIAGLVRGASVGEGLGNKFLSHIREVDAIIEVVRIFRDENILHTAGEIEPLEDINVINLELVLADLDTLSKRVSSVEKDAKKGSKIAKTELDILRKIGRTLEEGKLASQAILGNEEIKFAKKNNLLTIKPILYGLNKKTDGDNILDGEIFFKLIEFFNREKSEYIIFDAVVEVDMSNLDNEDEKEYRSELGLEESGMSELIRKSYEMLNLLTFFTTGPEETRGWTIKGGTNAKDAGSAIHTDFSDKFIKADVISCEKLIECGGYNKASEMGYVRTEGKEYVVKDGDVITFKI